MTEKLRVEDIMLEYLPVAASRPVGSLDGLHHAQLRSRVETGLRGLTLTLEAYVLAAPKKSATEKILVAVAERPRWIPKFLWKKIPLRIVEHKLTVDVREIFPHSREVFPLGRSRVHTTHYLTKIEYPEHRKARP